MNIIYLSFPFQQQMPNIPTTQQILAIGDFDGVHLGHQDVISRAIGAGTDAGLPVSVMTFHPHPREVLGLTKYSKYLTPLEEKLTVFESLGIDNVYVVSFDEELSRVSPELFIEHMLVPMKLHSIVVGFDFRFGYQGSGTVETLRHLCAPQIRVHIVEPYHLQGNKVSSTLIRELLDEGSVSGANELLGRAYTICGKVIKGDGRGKSIGFPTANIQVDEPFILPGNGVYAVDVRMDDRDYKGVMNIGVVPTFKEGNERTLEVHIIDFSDSIYGQSIRVFFKSFIRSEQKFESVQHLIAQISKDVETAKQFSFR